MAVIPESNKFNVFSQTLIRVRDSMIYTEWIIEVICCATEDRTVFNTAQDAVSKKTQNITIGMNIAKDSLRFYK